VREAVSRKRGAHILVIGVYLDQLGRIAEELNAPLITGAIKNKEREEEFSMHRQLFLTEQGYPYKIVDEEV